MVVQNLKKVMIIRVPGMIPIRFTPMSEVMLKFMPEITATVFMPVIMMGPQKHIMVIILSTAVPEGIIYMSRDLTKQVLKAAAAVII